MLKNFELSDVRILKEKGAPCRSRRTRVEMKGVNSGGFDSLLKHFYHDLGRNDLDREALFQSRDSKAPTQRVEIDPVEVGRLRDLAVDKDLLEWLC